MTATIENSDVWVYVAAGERVGLGHLSRGTAVAKALQESGVGDVKLLVESSLRDIASTVNLPAVQVRTSDEAIEVLTPQGLNSQAVVVTDLPSSHPAMAKSFLANRKLLVRLGGQEWGEGTGADIRFLHGPSPDEDSNAVQIRGLEYESIRPEISESRPTIWWSEDRVNKVLVIPGGSDTEGVLTKIASEAAASDLDISIRLVAGPATPASAIPTIDEREENVVLVPRPADIAKEILAADLVVTAGGQSTWEALHLGRPVASYHGSSKEIVGWFSENGFCVDLGPAEEIWPNLLSTLENTALLKQIAQTGYSTIDGKGSQRVAKVIAEAIHSR